MVKYLECREYSRAVGFSLIGFQELGQNVSIKFPRTEFFSPKDKLDSTPIPIFLYSNFLQFRKYLAVIPRQIWKCLCPVLMRKKASEVVEWVLKQEKVESEATLGVWGELNIGTIENKSTLETTCSQTRHKLQATKYKDIWKHLNIWLNLYIFICLEALVTVGQGVQQEKHSHSSL